MIMLFSDARIHAALLASSVMCFFAHFFLHAEREQHRGFGPFDFPLVKLALQMTHLLKVIPPCASGPKSQQRSILT